MLVIAYAAPFAAFRQFTAGFDRPTFAYPPPSALYGLLLHIAGVESRASLGPGPTVSREGLPSLRLASGLVRPRPYDHSFADLTGDQDIGLSRGRLFQLTHSVPVGEASEERVALCKGNKHHIAPASRGLLSTLHGVCAVQAGEAFERRLAEQIEEPGIHLADGSPRYGVPFLGDNNLFLEELEVVQPGPGAVSWLVSDPDGPFRLTLAIDRAGMKDTRQAPFSLREGTLDAPPEQAWVQLPSGDT